MAEKYRVGVLGMSHDHVWGNLQCLIESDEGELVAAADPHEELREQVKKMGCEKVYSDYYEMLDNEKLDAVYIFSDNRESAILAQEALGRGLHVMVEKPMAATAQLASRMRGAAKAAGKVLMINWPIAWTPAMRALKPLLEEGTIGRVLELKWRNGPSMGPLAYNKGDDVLTGAEKGSEWWHQSAPGGGVLLDYCCYGACLSRLLIGPATAASGRRARRCRRSRPPGVGSCRSGCCTGRRAGSRDWPGPT